jgi:hypothetical protein
LGVIYFIFYYPNILLMKYLASVLFLCISLTSFGQKDYKVLLSNGSVHLDSDITKGWESLKNDTKSRLGQHVYVLLQLEDIPTKTDKTALEKQGVELLHYIPNYAWIAKINQDIPTEKLTQLKLKGISEFKAVWKMSLALETANIPSHAGNIDLLSARVLFWKEKNTLVDYQELCEQAGLNVEVENQEKNWVEVNTSWLKLVAFAEHPLVQYIEFQSPPQEDEFKEEITQIQSNYISNNVGKGLFFDGTGVAIAVNEGGYIDSTYQVNFKNRLDRSLETGNLSGHKTGVGRRMASAGNLDPDFRGTAFGAILQSGGINFGDAAANGITIVNNSFGYGCIGSGTTSTYNSGAANNDNLVRTNPSFMITYSCGNMGGSDCGYGNGTAGAGWGNITGLVKSAKNIFAVGALNTSGELTGFSSRGPAWDGRILPDICATGPGGTSHASPNLAGVFAQLTHAYKEKNTGTLPKSGLIKAILMNSADDMLNRGPDFKSGYGKINARKAYQIIDQNQFATASIAQGGSNTHNITVPNNVKEVKVMVYWTDYEAVAGITSRALVNDLDIRLEDPAAMQWQPWVLNPTPDSLLLESPALRTRDSLNNVEQVSLLDPVSGNYTLHVDGFVVPQGPQEYFIVYEFIYDELYVTYPLGGEHFTPNSTERIRWDSQGDTTNTFDLLYSLDNGNTWVNIASNLDHSTRFYNWSVPDTFSSTALVRVSRGSVNALSDANFSIMGQVQNLNIVWSCSDSSLIYWDSIPNADGYVIYQLGTQYMDSIAYSTSNSFILNNLSLFDSEYLAIAAVKNNSLGKRSLAIERLATNVNCTPYDVGLISLATPDNSVLPSCSNNNSLAIKVNIRNWGTNTLSFIPFAYSLDGQTPILDTVYSNLTSGNSAQLTLSTPLNLTVGSHSLVIWSHYPADGNVMNDSLMDSLFIYNSLPATLPLINSFDTFALCSTAWGCESEICNLSQGWYNVINTEGDAIDWRTDENGTGTGGTGPSADHTSGMGNYLYLEGSGNGGSGCTYKEAILHSPCLDFNNVIDPNLSFWYHAYGGGIGSLHVDVIADGNLHQDVMPVIQGDQGNQWDSISVDLSAFVDQKVVLVFRGITGGGYQCDLAIDDVNVEAQSITSIDDLVEESNKQHFKLYPNPNNGTFSIDLQSIQTKATVLISNTLGQIVQQSTHKQKQRLDLSFEASPGVYFILIKTDENTEVTFKIVKKP